MKSRAPGNDPGEKFEVDCKVVSAKFTDLFTDLCARFPRMAVLTAMTGALSVCAAVSGQPRNKVIAVINSCFDDIEEED